METFQYFYDKWMNEAVFLELVVPEYLICPLSHKIFDNPIMLDNGEVYDRSAIPEELEVDPISKKPLTASKQQILDLQLKAACDHFYDNNEWALDYRHDGPKDKEGKRIQDANFMLVMM